MKLFENSIPHAKVEDELIRPHHKTPGGHIPPHIRKALIPYEINQDDVNLLKEIYGDEDEAFAALSSIIGAPPEIQFIATQLSLGTLKVPDFESEPGSYLARFDVPGLDENTKRLYGKLYGETGERALSILSDSPNEIAVISRLIAHIASEKRGE